MRPLGDSQSEGEYFATYINGMLLVEVSLLVGENVEQIRNYICSMGIQVPVRVYSLRPQIGNISTLPGYMPPSAREIGSVRASSLDELIVHASQIISIQDKKIIDGRTPVKIRPNITYDDSDAMPIEYLPALLLKNKS